MCIGCYLEKNLNNGRNEIYKSNSYSQPVESHVIRDINTAFTVSIIKIKGR